MTTGTSPSGETWGNREPAGSGRGELRAQARIDQVDVLLVGPDVARGERTRRDDGLAARADVVERLADERAAEPLPLVALGDLGVRDDDAVPGRPILRPSDQLAVDAQLAAALLGVVLDGPGHPATVPARPGDRRRRRAHRLLSAKVAGAGT